MKIAFKSFGCKTNSLETEVLCNEARLRGWEIVGENQVADAYVINSCTVTYAADRDTRREALRLKLKNPSALIGIVGCYPQVSKEELLLIPEIDFVIGTSEKEKILECISLANTKRSLARDQVQAPMGFLPEFFPGSRNARASIKIQDGCNLKCSYCIVPSARGKNKSLPLNLVLSQIRRAHQQGFHEVSLTGIHLGHYGWDLGLTLVDLLDAEFRNNDGPRIRLSTLDPLEINDHLVAFLTEEKRLCPHFHLGLQSGSNRILRRMRRVYKAEDFIKKTLMIRSVQPDTFIGADVIIGFPGETDEDYAKTIDCLEQSCWTKLHVFPFSVRKGTGAEMMKNRVQQSTIFQRAQKLRNISTEKMRSFMHSQIGKHLNIILEKPSKKFNDLWIGHSENYLLTYSRTPKNIHPKGIVPSKAVAIKGDRLLTEPL